MASRIEWMGDMFRSVMKIYQNWSVLPFVIAYNNSLMINDDRVASLIEWKMKSVNRNKWNRIPKYIWSYYDVVNLFQIPKRWKRNQNRKGIKWLLSIYWILVKYDSRTVESVVQHSHNVHDGLMLWKWKICGFRWNVYQ